LNRSKRKPPAIDRTTRFLNLRDAVTIIGKARWAEWQDTDINRLAQSREECLDVEAWDRAAHGRRQLELWLIEAVISAYGVDSEDRKVKIEPKWLTTPYFKLDVSKSKFLQINDEWEPIWIDGFDLHERVNGVRRIFPRKRQTFEWRDIVHQAWVLALSMELPRTQTGLVGQIAQWYLDGPGDGHAVPDEKELKALAKGVLDFLGDRVLSGEVSSSESPPVTSFSSG
jgi:hypothetical protein